MKCGHNYCRLDLEDDFETILEQGYGYCKEGHKTYLPGDIREDYNCVCGARKAKQPGHSFYCDAYYKRMPLL